MTAIYVERYLNYGLTREELQSGRPIIGIAQIGSDLTPCNRGHLETVKRAKEGVRDAGGIPIEFPVHPIQESCRRPTAALDRNLAYLGLVEILHGYPFDGVILTTGCDKTTPACLMAAATVDIPAIVLSGGPMLDGWHEGERAGSGTMLWEGRKALAGGRSHTRSLLNRWPHPRRVWTLQHHGHGAFHELSGRSVGHVVARVCVDPCAISGAVTNESSHRAPDCRDG